MAVAGLVRRVVESRHAGSLMALARAPLIQVIAHATRIGQ